MLFTDIIRAKRDGRTLDEQQIEIFVQGLADGSLPAEQVSALAMAVFFNGLDFDETASLTLKMAASGEMLDWSTASLDGPVVDKHSTGGVGDKVSFLLAPIVAACGAYVPMISGRGLGHTGGTTDKVESIPGYRSMPDFDTFREVVRQHGCAIIGQTADLAPADKRFYAIRDVTSTVESVSLITASILSKKIAAGLTGLVMDVKVGNGAFMENVADAITLAGSIINTADRAGLATDAVLTDMNEVLGDSAGNAVEIAEAVRYLRNDYRETRLDDVTLNLCAQMLTITGLESDRTEALRRVTAAVESGSAAEKFAQMVSALGGPSDFLEQFEKHLPAAPIVQLLTPQRQGYVVSIDTRKVGNAIIELGGGRRVLGDPLDLAVGLTDIVRVGDQVGPDRPLAKIHASSEDKARAASELLIKAIAIGAEPPSSRPLIIDIVSGQARHSA